MLDSAKSPSALKAVARQATDLLASRIDALGEQYNKGMGTTIDPIKLLTPKAQGVWSKLNSPEPTKTPKPNSKIHDLGDGVTMEIH